jgi:hypothetical protein
MKDSPDISNAFKIMSHPDVFIFKSETPSAKRELLQTLKKLTDDLVSKKKVTGQRQKNSNENRIDKMVT